jgi:hypothetical protein
MDCSRCKGLHSRRKGVCRPFGCRDFEARTFDREEEGQALVSLAHLVYCRDTGHSNLVCCSTREVYKGDNPGQRIPEHTGLPLRPVVNGTTGNQEVTIAFTISSNPTFPNRGIYQTTKNSEPWETSSNF